MGYYKRNLPHYQPEGYIYFVTTRLAGTIPKNIYSQIKLEYEKELAKVVAYQDVKIKREKYSDLRKSAFIKYERILDSCKYGYKWLKEEQVANVVKNALHFRDNKQYNLIAYTIMSNHIHIVFRPIIENTISFVQSKNIKERSDSGESLYIVTKIMQDLKKFTAKESNKILNRSGKFWQHESYDHVVRDEKELYRVVKYVLNNPVKANLCKTTEDWKWNYYNPKYFV